MSDQIRSFEDLDVFKRAYRAALDIHRLTLTFPEIEQRALADQMRRASRSICANVAEGFGKQRISSGEFRRYLGIAIGSSDEMQVWLQFACDLHYLEPATTRRWREEYREIARMLNGLRQSWR